MKIFINLLTTSRIPLIIIVLLLNLFKDPSLHPIIFFLSIAIMILIGITDFFDGYLARKYKVTSDFGAQADPLTDKIFFLTSLPLLVYQITLKGDKIHAILMVLLCTSFAIRDQIITFFRSIGSQYNISAKASWYGKFRTALSFPSIIFIYYFVNFPHNLRNSNNILSVFVLPKFIIFSLEILLIFLTILTFIMYLIKYYPALKGSFNKNGK